MTVSAGRLSQAEPKPTIDFNIQKDILDSKKDRISDESKKQMPIKRIAVFQKSKDENYQVNSKLRGQKTVDFKVDLNDKDGLK